MGVGFPHGMMKMTWGQIEVKIAQHSDKMNATELCMAAEVTFQFCDFYVYFIISMSG
jgi:hypothetical protein